MSEHTAKWCLILLIALVLGGAILAVGRDRHASPRTGVDERQASDVLLQGSSDYGGDDTPFTLSWLPPRSWKLTGSQDLIDAVADAARSARLLPSPTGTDDCELLYVRGSDGRAFTVSYVVDRHDNRVILAEGRRESKKLYRLLERARREAGPEQAQPWPKDALTVPHNRW